MAPPEPDQIQVSDIIDSLRAAGMEVENFALDQVAAALHALAEAGHVAWAQLDGLLDKPDALAAFLREQGSQGADANFAGGDFDAQPDTPPDHRT